MDRFQTTTTGGVDRFTTAGPKAVQYHIDATKAQAESEKANSFWGLTKNFLKSIPSSFAEVGKGLYHGLKEPLVHPNAQQQEYERTTFPTPANKTIAAITKPGQTAAKYITRFLAPALQPLGNDIAEIKAINEKGGIADQVSEGKIPHTVLNEFAVLQKTAPQIVGDVAQAVLSAYAGGEGEKLLAGGAKQTAKQALTAGLKSGLATGELFGGAQALSSGSKNPLEILATIGTSGAAGGILGAITSGAISVPKELFEKVKDAKAIYDSMSPQERQAGFVKNPFKTKELNVIADHIDETGISKEEFLKTHDSDLDAMLKKEGVTPEEFFTRATEAKSPVQERLENLAAEFKTEDAKIAPEQLPPEQPVETENGSPAQAEPATPQTEAGATGSDMQVSGGNLSSKELIPQKFDADKYIKEQITKREKARSTDTLSIKSKVKKFLANAKAKLVDFTSPIEDILNEATKKEGIKLSAKEDIHNQIDRVLRSPTIAGEFARSHGLVDVIKQVDNIDALDQYLIAKHAVELDTRGIETGRDIAKDELLVNELNEKYEPYAKVISEYSRDLLDYTVEAGLISKELADALKERYPDYVPFNRVFTELEKNGYEFGSSGVASLSKQDVIQKIEGSTREVENPIESLLAKTNDAFRQGEKNIAGRILASYENLPDNPFQLRELEPGEQATHTISFLDDGVKRTYETLPEVAAAAKSLNVQQLNVLGKIFALPVRIARIGITGINLPFVAANLAKDQVSAFINSRHSLATSLANPLNFVKGIFSAVKHDELYHEIIKEGGSGTSFDIAREQAPKTIEKIRSEKSLKSRILYTVKNPSQLLRAVEDIIAISEESTRIQQYRGTRNKLLKKGMAPEEARAEGARAYRENTVNFARRGEWGTVLNSAFLYLNAGIQGTRTLLGNLRDHPIETTAKIAIAGFTPVAIATAWNLSDPKRRQAYEDIADYEKENNIIIIPPNPTKGEDGKWNVIKIPLSQEIKNLIGLVRRPIEQAYGLSPVQFKDFANAIIGTVEPIEPTKGSILSTLTPQAIKPAIEASVNKNLFTGFPIVPQSMEKLSPKNQVKPGTSGSARKIGELLNVSPLKVEAFIKETFGGVGPQALNVVDQVLAGAKLIPKDQIGGQNILDAITARFNKASGGQLEQKDITEIQKLITQQADKAQEIKSESEEKWAELKALPKEQAKEEFNKIAKENPTLAKKIADIAADEKKGLTTTDRFIKQLQVTNGERAQYIANKLNELTTKEEKAALWQEYVDKGLISAQVSNQLKTLLNK